MFGKFIKNTITGISGAAGRRTNKHFMEGLFAAVALVAGASGGVGAEEKRKFGRIIELHPDLQHFDHGDMTQLFNKYCELAEVSTSRLWKEIDEVPSDQRQDVVEMVFGIANADGTIDDAEKKVLRELMSRWGVDPRKYLG